MGQDIAFETDAGGNARASSITCSKSFLDRSLTDGCGKSTATAFPSRQTISSMTRARSPWRFPRRTIEAGAVTCARRRRLFMTSLALASRPARFVRRRWRRRSRRWGLPPVPPAIAGSAGHATARRASSSSTAAFPRTARCPAPCAIFPRRASPPTKARSPLAWRAVRCDVMRRLAL